MIIVDNLNVIPNIDFEATGVKITTYYKNEDNGYVYGFLPSWKKIFRRIKMKLWYKNLLVKLAELEMKRTQFSSAKVRKGENITTDVLLKTCGYLNCDIDKIIEVVQHEE